MTEPLEAGLADRMLERAVARCAEAHFAGDARRARLALLRGDCRHCACITEALIPQVAEYIGRKAEAVRAVYRVRPENKQEQGSITPRAQPRAACLVVWVERKSAALNELAASLEVELASGRNRLGCPVAGPACYAIDIEVVDDGEVQEQRGLGLIARHSRLIGEVAWTASAGPSQEGEGLPPERLTYSVPETFDPDLMPAARLAEHALAIERLAPEGRGPLEHHLTELKVTLMRKIISDQLDYIDIAKRWFDAADLSEILRHRIGRGKIGGKSAGMLLAGRILRTAGGEDLRAAVTVPESFFLGSDLMYIFMAMNGLMHWNDQKYKPEDQIRDDFPRLVGEFEAGEFPPEIRIELEAMLEQIGPRPLIVRSSSQLEDRLGTSFAGKYDSYFCPNQGSAGENLQALILAVARTYASTFRPDALLYRRSRGLQDYDERMAVLIQPVEGERWGRFFFPFGAGVGFSRNLYRWSPQIRMEDGFCRLVWGLGTRAVERVGTDYARLIALSHPRLQPDDSPQALRQYSQQYVDVIDLEDNSLKTLPLRDALAPDYPPLRYLVQVEQEGYLWTPRRRLQASEMPHAVITFDAFLARTRFARLLSELLRLLEREWDSPVDVEFTVGIGESNGSGLELRLALLQCRPLPALGSRRPGRQPVEEGQLEVVLSSRSVVFDGYLADVRHVLLVVPEAYFALPTRADRLKVARVVGRVNSILPPKSFICVGPGRWGTENLDLGVLVGYSDICHAGALVELSGKAVGPAAEPSLGTHFFHDLLEALIYPVAADLDREDTVFRQDFFFGADSCLESLVEVDATVQKAVRLIDVGAFRPGHHLELRMEAEQGRTLALLAPDKETG